MMPLLMITQNKCAGGELKPLPRNVHYFEVLKHDIKIKAIKKYK